MPADDLNEWRPFRKDESAGLGPRCLDVQALNHISSSGYDRGRIADVLIFDCHFQKPRLLRVDSKQPGFTSKEKTSVGKEHKGWNRKEIKRNRNNWNYSFGFLI